MFRNVVVLVTCILIPIGITTISIEPFEKIVLEQHDLSSLESKHRFLRPKYDKIKPDEIFHNFSNVQIIENDNLMFMEICDKHGRQYIDLVNQTSLVVLNSVLHKPTIETILQLKYDQNLHNCLRHHCESRVQGVYRLDCSHRGIFELQVHINVTSCNAKVTNVNFQNNNISVIKTQSFMKIFVYVVRVDLRNNPITTFNHKSFRLMKLLRFLHVPYADKVIDKKVIDNLMRYSTYLLFVECSTGTEAQFYAWNGYCKNSSSADFFDVSINTANLITQKPTSEAVIEIRNDFERLRYVYYGISIALIALIWYKIKN